MAVPPQLIIRRPLWRAACLVARSRRTLLLPPLLHCHHPRSLSRYRLPTKTRFLARPYTLIYGHSYTTATAATAFTASPSLRESMASVDWPKDMFVELTAPNGRRYTQPLGLFINGEWVAAKSGEKITSINPTYAFFSSLLRCNRVFWKLYKLLLLFILLLFSLLGILCFSFPIFCPFQTGKMKGGRRVR